MKSSKQWVAEESYPDRTGIEMTTEYFDTLVKRVQRDARKDLLKELKQTKQVHAEFKRQSDRYDAYAERKSRFAV